MKERCKELPEELWESILHRLALDDDHYCELQSPSLVCKQFLSIANRFRRKLVTKSNVLNISKRYETFCRALERFKNLKEIVLYEDFSDLNVNCPVLKIACSGLDLQSLSFYYFPISPSADSFRRLGTAMNNLKVLRCTAFISLGDPDLVHIADALPGLEELDIQYPRNTSGSPCKVRYPELSNHMVTDAGIEAISCKLQGLRRIGISGNEGCSDRSLIALSSNCLLLTEIKCCYCNITRRGIDWVLGHSTNLTSLLVGSYGSSRNPTSPFDDMKISAAGLRELSIYECDDQERLLCSIAKAGVPLEKLILHGFRWYKHCGVMTLLRSCPTLKHLILWGAYPFNDDFMRDICPCLPKMESIELQGCFSLTATTFSVFTKECPALSKITLRNGSLGRIQDDFVMNLERNYRIRYLELSYNQGLNDKLLKDIVVACPNLHTLKVRERNLLTKEGLEEILMCCPQIKHLTLTKYREILSKTFETRQIKIEFW